MAHRILRFLLGTPLAAPLFASSLPAQAPPSAVLLATNQFANTLSIIDPVAGKEIAVLPEEHITGHELETSPDGRSVFIPIYGNSGVGKPGTDGHEILVVDIPSRRIAHVIDLGRGVRPHKAVYNHATASSTSPPNSTTPSSSSIPEHSPRSAPSHRQARVHMFVLSPDGRSRLHRQRLHRHRLRPRPPSPQAPHRHPRRPRRPAHRHLHRRALVFTSDTDKHELDVIDTRSNTVKIRIPLPANGYGSAAAADGRSLLVALPATDQVAVVDLHTLTVTRTIPTPSGPQAILLRPDGRIAYVSCMHSKSIVAIDTNTFAITQHIPAGDGVDGLAWANPKS